MWTVPNQQYYRLLRREEKRRTEALTNPKVQMQTRPLLGSSTTTSGFRTSPEGEDPAALTADNSAASTVKLIDPVRALHLSRTSVAKTKELTFSSQHLTGLHSNFLWFENLETLFLHNNNLRFVRNLIALPPALSAGSGAGGESHRSRARGASGLAREGGRLPAVGPGAAGAIPHNRLSGPRGCVRLRRLVLSQNRLCDLARETDIPRLRSLEYLCLRRNHLGDLPGLVDALQRLRALAYLDLEGNPACAYPCYRLYVVGRLPQVEVLDRVRVTTQERRQAAAFLKESREGLGGDPMVGDTPRAHATAAPRWRKSDPLRALKAERDRLLREQTEAAEKAALQEAMEAEAVVAKRMAFHAAWTLARAGGSSTMAKVSSWRKQHGLSDARRASTEVTSEVAAGRPGGRDAGLFAAASTPSPSSSPPCTSVLFDALLQRESEVARKAFIASRPEWSAPGGDLLPSPARAAALNAASDAAAGLQLLSDAAGSPASAQAAALATIDSNRWAMIPEPWTGEPPPRERPGPRLQDYLVETARALFLTRELYALEAAYGAGDVLVVLLAAGGGGGGVQGSRAGKRSNTRHAATGPAPGPGGSPSRAAAILKSGTLARLMTALPAFAPAESGPEAGIVGPYAESTLAAFLGELHGGSGARGLPRGPLLAAVLRAHGVGTGTWALPSLAPSKNHHNPTGAATGTGTGAGTGTSGTGAATTGRRKSLVSMGGSPRTLRSRRSRWGAEDFYALESGTSGVGSEDPQPPPASLSVNNLIGALISYVPFVASRVEFFRRRSLECVMANDTLASGGASSNLRHPSSHSSGLHLHSLNNVAIDFSEEEADAMMWFRRLQKSEDHLKKMLAKAQDKNSYVEISAIIDPL